MEIDIIELATLLLNYNASQWDANANNQRIELKVYPGSLELVNINTDCNGYQSEFPLAEGGISDLISVMRTEVHEAFKRGRM